MNDLDLIVRGGRVLDPARGVDGIADIAIKDGRIVELAAELDPESAHRVIDCVGRLITPGLIDLHAHVLGGVIEMAADADDVGVGSGVTTVIDAGSAGPATIGAFANWVIPQSRTRIVPFLHIGQTGLATKPDIRSQNDVDFGLVEQALADYDGLIGGLKVRMVNPALSIFGLGMLERATAIAHAAKLPVMVHIGDLLDEADIDLGRRTLELLGPGDIVTHVFTPHRGGVLDQQGRVFPEALEAARRGVLFDAAHGRRNLSFDVLRAVLDQGVPITAISSDLTADGRRDIVYTLTEIMSRYLGLGLGLAEVIELTTAKPAAAARLSDAGSLAVGAVADISVLEVLAGEWDAEDSTGQLLRLDRLIVPRAAIRSGALIEAGPGPHPHGWLPDSFTERA